jgi:hypothetical protein
MKVADLSQGALTAALADTAGQSLQWIWRFANGYQDVGASAAWSPASGWTFGYDDYTTGGGVCDSLVPAQEKCVVYPQKTKIVGKVDQGKDTITLQIPKALLRQLSGTDGSGRPVQRPATVGARFYDGTAFSVANNISPTQAHQTFLYPLDNTAAMDFRLPKAALGTTGEAAARDSLLTVVTKVIKQTLDTVTKTVTSVEKVVPSTVSPKVEPPKVSLPPLPKLK